MSIEPHPPLFELEALHAGEGSPGIARHAESCASCRAYLDELEREASRFATERDPEAFVRGVRARVEAEAAPQSARAPGHRAARGRWRQLAGSAALALSGGAAIGALWLLTARAPATSDRVQSRGGVQVAALVLHGDTTERRAGDIAGQPGDRFRVEITLTAPATLDALVADDHGRVMVLCEGRRFEPGTHYLDPALAFDDAATTARLLVGPAGSVRRALTGAAAPGVVVVPVHSQGRR